MYRLWVGGCQGMGGAFWGNLIFYFHFYDRYTFNIQWWRENIPRGWKDPQCNNHTKTSCTKLVYKVWCTNTLSSQKNQDGWAVQVWDIQGWSKDMPSDLIQRKNGSKWPCGAFFSKRGGNAKTRKRDTIKCLEIIIFISIILQHEKKKTETGGNHGNH